MGGAYIQQLRKSHNRFGRSEGFLKPQLGLYVESMHAQFLRQLPLGDSLRDMLKILASEASKMDTESRNRTYRRLYRALYPALIEKNQAALERLLDDSFVLREKDGPNWSKQQFINAVCSGTLEYCAAEEDSIAIDEEAGVLAGRSRVEMSTPSSPRRWRDRQLDIVMVQDGGNWRIGPTSVSVF